MKTTKTLAGIAVAGLAAVSGLAIASHHSAPVAHQAISTGNVLRFAQWNLPASAPVSVPAPAVAAPVATVPVSAPVAPAQPIVSAPIRTAPVAAAPVVTTTTTVPATGGYAGISGDPANGGTGTSTSGGYAGISGDAANGGCGSDPTCVPPTTGTTMGAATNGGN